VVAAGPGVVKLAGAVPVHTALGGRRGLLSVDVEFAGPRGQARNSLCRAAGRVVIGVQGASLAVLAADVVEDGAHVGAAEEVRSASLTLRDRSRRLGWPEWLRAGANCRCACKCYEEQA
jgi:hypothetical protein